MQKWLDRWLIGPSSDIGLLSLLLLAVIMTADAVSRSAGFSLVDQWRFACKSYLFFYR